MRRVDMVLGRMQIAPTDLSAEEWGALLYELLHYDATLDFVRGMQSVRQLLEPATKFDVMYRARSTVIRTGLSGTGMKSDDMFLYCTTIFDTTYPQGDLTERAKKGEIFKNSRVVLSKKGTFWKIHADWRYTTHTEEAPNPWGTGEPWLDAQSVKLEYIGFGEPLGELCLQEHVTYGDRIVGPRRLHHLVGGKILCSLRNAHADTSKELSHRAERTGSAAQSFERSISFLGR